MEIPLIHSLCIVYGCNSFCVWISNTLHTQTTFPFGLVGYFVHLYYYPVHVFCQFGSL